MIKRLAIAVRPGLATIAKSMLVPIAAPVLACISLASPAVAAEDSVEVPYWAAIRAGVVNMRAGPGEDYHITWVYRRPQLPVKVLRLKEGWRLVQDPDGTRGWMLARFLSRKRGAIVQGHELADMREKGNGGARLLWRLQPGVVGQLGDCADGWCHFELNGRVGYVPQANLWGAGEP